MRYLFLFVISLWVSSAQAAFQSESFTLDNGMQVVVVPNHKVEVVTHMVWYKRGAIDENQGKSGIAHLLEHLMFKGTASFPKGQFSRNIAKVGGNDNAFTSNDYTAYYQVVPRSKLEMVMKMESDRMQNLLFDEASVEKERQVVVEERLMRVDNKPGARLQEQMKAALFRNHPYHRPVIGWMHEIKQLTLSDARQFYINHYAPNQAILVVSGDIKTEELRLLAEQYYGHIKAQPHHERPYIRLQEPYNDVPLTMTLQDDKVAHPEWSRYYKAISQHTEHKQYAYALTILEEYLSSGTTSRLYQKLVVEDKTALEVEGYYDDINLGPSIYALHVVPTSETEFEKVESTIEKELVKVQEQGVEESMLARIKQKLINQTIYAQEDIKTLALIYGQAWAAGLGSEYVESWTENIQKVTNEDIKKAAQLTFQETHSVTGRLVQ